MLFEDFHFIHLVNKLFFFAQKSLLYNTIQYNIKLVTRYM